MRFWLGTHLPHWLSHVDTPLFVSRTRLQHRTTLPRARGPWALDSGAFSGRAPAPHRHQLPATAGRRQATRQIAALVADLAAGGLRLHGFGVKTAGLAIYAAYLHSADSLAWSLRGRRVRPCAHGPARSEANCPQFALAWRARVLAAAAHPQLDLLAETRGAAADIDQHGGHQIAAVVGGAA